MVCFVAVSIFVLLLSISIGPGPLFDLLTCDITDDPNTKFNYMFIGASGSCCVVQIIKIFSVHIRGGSKTTYAVYFTALVIMLINLSSEVFRTFTCFGNLKDVFNVESSFIQYNEWSITVPLM